MKTKILSLICILMAAMPLGAEAQTNIRKAFDKLIQSGDVTLSESHSKEKDTDTGMKQSQSDIYKFVLPSKKIGLVDNIVKAFRDDDNLAYSTSSGVTAADDRDIVLAVGDGNNGGVQVTQAGRRYVYACFLASPKEDPSGNYRYAYAMNWEEKSGEIHGTLIVTYATTLKHRQSASSARTVTIYNGDRPMQYTFSGNTDNSFINSWFTVFMGYVNMMSSEHLKTRQTMAAKIYEHCKNTSDVSSEDKATAREVLKKLMADDGDSVITQLLKSALANLK